MPGHQDRKLTNRLRRITDRLEELMRDLDGLLESLSSEDSASDRAGAMHRTLRLAYRDLLSAQALVFLASLARTGVLKRLLQAALGRPLVGSVAAASAPLSSHSSALDPYRLRLADSALEAERLYRTLSPIRDGIEQFGIGSCRAESDGDMAQRPESVVAFAGVLVDGAIESLEEAQRLLFRAAELTEGQVAPPSSGGGDKAPK
ncbi:MAG: hypothetical protein MPN21_11065 [Thermoanaerobaculia bacterium]|nr:hypothetical protein [Thermoanaerobaculia bacterium]